MPIHDWSRVDDGVFHDFHCRWIVTLSDALNNGLLPRDFYAMAERYDDGYVPDVLTLQEARGGNPHENGGGGVAGATAVAVAPPRVRTVSELAREAYLGKQKTLVVRRVAMNTPSAIETGNATASATVESSRVDSSRENTPSRIGWPLAGEIPQLPVRKLPSHMKYRSSTGRSRPY